MIRPNEGGSFRRCSVCKNWTLAAKAGRCERCAREAGPAIQVMDGETGKTPIESDPAWLCDLLTIDGADMAGYIGPEHEDVPPCCPAPAPRAP